MKNIILTPQLKTVDKDKVEKSFNTAIDYDKKTDNIPTNRIKDKKNER